MKNRRLLLSLLASLAMLGSGLTHAQNVLRIGFFPGPMPASGPGDRLPKGTCAGDSAGSNAPSGFTSRARSFTGWAGSGL